MDDSFGLYPKAVQYTDKKERNLTHPRKIAKERKCTEKEPGHSKQQDGILKRRDQ